MMPKRKKKAKAVRPPIALPTPATHRVEIRSAGRGRRRVLVCDCDEIRAYSREEVSFRHGRALLTVRGRDLWCRTYGYRTAEVIGRVDAVLFDGGEADRT